MKRLSDGIKVKICGNVWNLRIFSTPGPQGCILVRRSPPEILEASADGYCDGPHIKDKQIVVRDNSALLETLIHECLHAADWSKDEEWVHEAAADIAGVLARVGYTLTHAPNAG